MREPHHNLTHKQCSAGGLCCVIECVALLSLLAASLLKRYIRISTTGLSRINLSNNELGDAAATLLASALLEGGIADPASWTRRPAQQAAAGPLGFQAPRWGEGRRFLLPLEEGALRVPGGGLECRLRPHPASQSAVMECLISICWWAVLSPPPQDLHEICEKRGAFGDDEFAQVPGPRFF